jgi:hypothetical protein
VLCCRYRAVVYPLAYHVRRRQRVLCFAVLGAAVGALCSLINMLALHLLAAQTGGGDLMGATCTVTTHTATAPHASHQTPQQTAGVTERAVQLEGIISVKCLSLLFMYICPCACIIVANIGMAGMLRKRKRSAELSRTYSAKNIRKKNKKTIHFILLSTILMVFCLPQPLWDLYKAVNVYLKPENGAAAAAAGNYIGEMLSSLVISLSSVAYMLNTLVGIWF